MHIALYGRGSYRAAQRRPEVVLESEQLAGIMPTLPQCDQTTRRATLTQAERNTAAARRFLFRGAWRTAREIADVSGMPLRTVRNRISGDAVIDGERISGPVPKTYQFRGERLTIKQICERTNLSRDIVTDRLLGDRFHAFGELQDHNPEPRIDAHLITYDGRTLTLSQWARNLGLHVNTLASRLGYGWTKKRALTTPRRREASPSPSTPGGMSRLSNFARGPATSGPKLIHNHNQGVTP